MEPIHLSAPFFLRGDCFNRVQILIYRCVTTEVPSKINAQTCRDRRPRLSENEGCLLSKCRVSFPREIYPFVLGQSRTPVPTGLYVIFAGFPYRNNSINPNLEAGDS